MDQTTELKLLMDSYEFTRDQVNMLSRAATKMGVDIWLVAEKVYTWECLDHFAAADWSVENIVKEYLWATAVGKVH